MHWFSDEGPGSNPVRPGVQAAQPPGGRLLRARVPRLSRNRGKLMILMSFNSYTYQGVL